MRTATTLHKTAKGWVLKHDPDVPFGRQKADFAAALQGNWPKDVLAIRFQTNDGKEKLLSSEKAGRQAALAKAQLVAESKLLKQIRDGKEARIKSAIAALDGQIATQKERVETFKAKAAASKDTKWNQQFVIEHKQAVATLAELEKRQSDLKDELAALEPKAPPAQSAVPA